jgi:hypothetical protein
MKSNKINKKRLKSIISEEFNKLSEDEMNEFLGMLPGSSKRKMADMIKKQNSESESGVTPEERSFMFDAAVQMVFADGVINILNKSKDPDVKRFVRFLQGSNMTEAEIGSQRRRNKPAGSSTGTTPEIAKAQAQSLQKAMKNTSLATGVWKALHLVKDLPSMREYMRGNIARKWLEKTASEWGTEKPKRTRKLTGPDVPKMSDLDTPSAGEVPTAAPEAGAEDPAAGGGTPEPASAPSPPPTKSGGVSKQSLDQMTRAMFSNLRFSKLTDTDKQTIKKAIYGWADQNLSLTEARILAFTEKINKLNELQLNK